MARIVVDPEALQAMAQRLEVEAQFLEGVRQAVGRWLNGLVWETRWREPVGAQVGQVLDQADALAQALAAMARYLAAKAEAFAQADAAGVAPGGGPAAVPAPPPADPAAPAAPGPVLVRDLAGLLPLPQARALAYVAGNEGPGFATVHGAVYYRDGAGQIRSDGTLLNYGLISFAFPGGGGYALLHRLVRDPAAWAAFERLAQDQGLDPEQVKGFQAAFAAPESPAAEGQAAAWWRAHAMAGEDRLRPEWARALAAWAGTEANRRIQVDLAATRYVQPAVAAARRLGIRSERGLAFLVDVAVQHGPGFLDRLQSVRDQVGAGWERLPEPAKLAHLLEAVPPEWRQRRAELVHGGAEFEARWGLRYGARWDLSPAAARAR